MSSRNRPFIVPRGDFALAKIGGLDTATGDPSFEWKIIVELCRAFLPLVGFFQSYDGKTLLATCWLQTQLLGNFHDRLGQRPSTLICDLNVNPSIRSFCAVLSLSRSHSGRTPGSLASPPQSEAVTSHWRRQVIAIQTNSRGTILCSGAYDTALGFKFELSTLSLSLDIHEYSRYCRRKDSDGDSRLIQNQACRYFSPTKSHDFIESRVSSLHDNFPVKAPSPLLAGGHSPRARQTVCVISPDVPDTRDPLLLCGSKKILELPFIWLHLGDSSEWMYRSTPDSGKLGNGLGGDAVLHWLYFAEDYCTLQEALTNAWACSSSSSGLAVVVTLEKLSQSVPGTQRGMTCGQANEQWTFASIDLLDTTLIIFLSNTR